MVKMKILLPTVVEVEVSDEDLLALLKKKRLKILNGADYAEQEEGEDIYWLWIDLNETGVGKPIYEKIKEMSKLDYQLLESFTSAIYILQKTIEPH